MITDSDFTDEQLLLTTVQAAKVLGVGRTTIYGLIKRGEIHPVHIARSCRISWAELERFVARLDAGANEDAADAAVADPPPRRWRRVTSADGRRRVFAIDALEHQDASA